MGLLVRSPALISILLKHKESSSSLVSKSHIEQDNLFSVFLFLINYHLMKPRAHRFFFFNRCLSRVSILRIDNNSSPQMFFPFQDFSVISIENKVLASTHFYSPLFHKNISYYS